MASVRELEKVVRREDIRAERRKLKLNPKTNWKLNKVEKERKQFLGYLYDDTAPPQSSPLNPVNMRIERFDKEMARGIYDDSMAANNWMLRTVLLYAVAVWTLLIWAVGAVW